MLRRYLKEAAVINVDDVTAVCDAYGRAVDTPEAKAWFAKKLRSHILNNVNALRRVDSSITGEILARPQNQPQWLLKAIEDNEPVYEFVWGRSELKTECDHIRDFFQSLEQSARNNSPIDIHVEDRRLATKILQKLTKMGYWQVLAASEEWFSRMSKRAAAGDKGGCETVYSWSDGYYAVRYTELETMKADGADLQNCLATGTYWNAVVAGREAIYGIRNPSHEAIIGIRISQNPKQLHECKGKNNKPPKSAYVPYAVEFLTHLGVRNDISELREIGVVAGPRGYGSITEVGEVVKRVNGLTVWRGEEIVAVGDKSSYTIFNLDGDGVFLPPKDRDREKLLPLLRALHASGIEVVRSHVRLKKLGLFLGKSGWGSFDDVADSLGVHEGCEVLQVTTPPMLAVRVMDGMVLFDHEPMRARGLSLGGTPPIDWNSKRYAFFLREQTVDPDMFAAALRSLVAAGFETGHDDEQLRKMGVFTEEEGSNEFLSIPENCDEFAKLKSFRAKSGRSLYTYPKGAKMPEALALEGSGPVGGYDKVESLPWEVYAVENGKLIESAWEWITRDIPAARFVEVLDTLGIEPANRLGVVRETGRLFNVHTRKYVEVSDLPVLEGSTKNFRVVRSLYDGEWFHQSGSPEWSSVVLSGGDLYISNGLSTRDEALIVQIINNNRPLPLKTSFDTKTVGLGLWEDGKLISRPDDFADYLEGLTEQRMFFTPYGDAMMFASMAFLPFRTDGDADSEDRIMKVLRSKLFVETERNGRPTIRLNPWACAFASATNSMLKFDYVAELQNRLAKLGEETLDRIERGQDVDIFVPHDNPRGSQWWNVWEKAIRTRERLDRA